MELIQYISFKKKDYSSMDCVSFRDVKTIDSYYINIIDLSDCKIWNDPSNDSLSLGCSAELKDIGQMVKTSRKSKLVVFLPLNLMMKYSSFSNQYEIELRKNITIVCNTIIALGLNAPSICFEASQKSIEGHKYKADFFINGILPLNTIIKSDDTEKCLVASVGNNKYISSLSIGGENELLSFLKYINLLDGIKDAQLPDWLIETDFFNDKNLKKQIDHNNKTIEELSEQNKEFYLNLEKNNDYKKVLSETGNTLVDIVFAILKEMVNADLESFIDEFKEDFKFVDKETGLTFLGEIKGVNVNVKTSHISQLNHHYICYLEDAENANDLDKNKIKKLLIINHQRSKPLNDREPINEEQIRFAKQTEVLIVETITLLRIFEKFRDAKINKNQVIDLFSNNIGKLEFN